MKLLIFGASGGVGRKLLEQASEKEYTVAAFTSNAGKLKTHGRVMLYEGDVQSMEQCAQAIDDFGPDAIAITLGGPTNHREPIRAQATQKILEAAKDKCSRILCLSSLGVGDSLQMLSPAAQSFMPMVLGGALRDHEAQEQLLEDSTTDWTVVRPSRLTDSRLDGDYKYGTQIEAHIGGQISRANVADFMLRLISEPESYGKTFWITS